MRPFDYVRAGSVAEAVAAWVPGSTYLAGGTNLVDLMKTGAMLPERLIDLKGVAGLEAIAMLPDGGVSIGAMVRNADLAYHGAFAAAFPLVAEAILSGASAQLRNAATTGGNVMQQTRCAYFQDAHSACNRRVAGSGCDAREGDNARHAILGWSEDCIATNPSDLCVALAAMDAMVMVEGPQGERVIPFGEFHRPPGSTPSRQTALESGELIVAVCLPSSSASFQANARYLKVRERTSFAFALVSVAAALRIRSGKIDAARLALGGVAAQPWRALEAQALLVGHSPTPEVFVRAAQVALAGAKPSGQNGYKIELARRAVARALTMAADGTPARVPALPASPFGERANV